MAVKRSAHDADDLSVMMTDIAVALESSNYPAPQAKTVLEHVATKYDTSVDVELTPTMVISQSRDSSRPSFRTLSASYRFDQMVAAQNVIAQARTNAPAPATVSAALESVRTLKPLFPDWLRVVGYALSALGFAASFQFDYRALLGATGLGLVIGVIVLYGSRVPGVSALLPFAATLVSGLLVAGAAIAFNSLDPVRLVAVAVVVLLPGAVLTSGLIELVSGYMVSGASRLIYALMILGTMAFGLAISLKRSGLTSSRIEDFTQHLTPLWMAWVGAAVFAIGTFLYFCTPFHLWVPSLVVIVVSYVIAMLDTHGFGAAVMAGVATFVGLILSWIINARMGGGPGDLAIFLPTFWLIVPGSVGFTAIAGSIEQMRSLSELAGQGALTFLSMAIAMMVAGVAYPIIGRITPNVTNTLKRGLEFFPTHLDKKKRV